MSQRKKPRKKQKSRSVARSTRVETLEARQVMSADPLGVPSLGHHAIVEAEESIPALSHHAIVEDAVPALTQHGVPSLSHHAIVEPDAEAPPLSHHVMGGGMSHAVIESAPVHDPNADFWISTELVDGDHLGGEIEQSLYDAHSLTGQDQVVADYGFDGSGQTVVVIDSGIAYEHYALGGGYGEGYRVVGGYDFTENDSDPYDDGPAGGHGTHVAGIIGAQGDGDDSGVATGVDLVGLRVFDDAGNGYFSWVESALDWVYDNRNAFENPITTVNLSLGTEWNSHSIPSWAMLEEEFAALESVGIFVSVSAGNSFQNYNTPGVSYPAGSDHVIPVMSVDDSGGLSYFSQRADYAIAAPGRTVTSTVPDYAAGDADTIDDDWASMSGTSMASPYVAGASVLVREAMEFVGMTDIDQWDIFDHMMATADEFYDSVTDAWYKRLNLETAIDALMPTDDYGSSVATAHDLGTIDPPDSNPLGLGVTSGVISTLDDSDYFSFTAGATGTVTFTVSDATHDLAVDWWGAGWSEDSPGVYTMDVLAGQTYTFGLGTSDGLGYYDLSFELESTFSAIEWGALAAQQTQSDLSVDGEAWFSVTAGTAGYVTADVVATDGAVTLEWYDADQNLLAVEGAADRVDAVVGAGDELLLRVVGDASDLDLRLTNAVSVDGSTVTVTGTSGDDALAFTAGGAEHTVSLNGVEYSFDAGSYDAFDLDGGAGSDSVLIVSADGDESATLGSEQTTVDSSDGWSVEASGYGAVEVQAGGGSDSAVFLDTAGDDTFVATPTQATLVSGSLTLDGYGFEVVSAENVLGLGADRAYLHGGDSDDVFTGRSEYSRLVGGGVDLMASGYERVDAYGNGGNDLAYQYDSAGDDVFTGRPEYATMAGAGFRNVAHDFDRVDAYTTGGGSDRAYLYDSSGTDYFVGRENYAHMTGSGFRNIVWNFERVDAYTFAGGDDLAYLYDSAGADRFVGRPTYALMDGDGYYNLNWWFETVYAFGGDHADDVAYLHGGDPSDVLTTSADHVALNGDGFYNYVKGFDDYHYRPAAATAAVGSVVADTVGTVGSLETGVSNFFLAPTGNSADLSDATVELEAPSEASKEAVAAEVFRSLARDSSDERSQFDLVIAGEADADSKADSLVEGDAVFDEALVDLWS